MWFLKGDNNGKLIYLKPNATTTVGRNKGDLILPEDGSISRVHAQIIVGPVLDLETITEKTQPLSKCTIKDPGSKYGNFIMKDDNGTRIADEGYELQHMDRVRFGLQNYIFTVHYMPIITSSSGLTKAENEKLKMTVEAIGGNYTYLWSHLCTHMTIGKPTITEKLSCSLVAQGLIVNMPFWESFTKAFMENTELPDPAAFASSIENRIQEVVDISISPNPVRQTLFQNLTFLLFNSKQLAVYFRMIELAGGKPLHYGHQRTDVDVSDDNVIVVQYVESNTTQATGTGDGNYAAVCEKLSECRRRTIPESEIPLAILHCSVEKYCNPKFDYATLFATRTTENETRDMTVLALDTQDVEVPSTSSRGKDNKQNTVANEQIAGSIHCIPESVQESCNTESQTTRKCPKNVSNDPTKRAKSSGSRSEEAGPSSESVTNSLPEDLPSESEIGSMKLASLNHENYVKEEYKKIASIKEISTKREREREDDEASESMKKKNCLGISSIESVTSKSDKSYEEMMPDDEDAFFMDEQVSIVEEVMEKRQERQTFTSRLSPKNESGRNVDAPERRRPIGTVDPVEKAVSSTTSIASASRIKEDCHRVRVFETEEENPMKNSTADNDKNSWKRTIVRSDISPTSDVAEDPHKCNKIEFANDRESDRPMQKATPVKRALMELPSPSSKRPKKNAIKKEKNSIRSTTMDDHLGSERDSGAGSDKWRTSSARDYDETELFKFPNDSNSTMYPLLRIQILQRENRPRTGKTFCKQKIMIPDRVMSNMSTNTSTAICEESWKKRASLDDEEEATTSRKVSPNVWPKAKKSFRV